MSTYAEAWHDERQEELAARDACDVGGYRRIAGAVVEEWPALDEASD